MNQQIRSELGRVSGSEKSNFAYWLVSLINGNFKLVELSKSYVELDNKVNKLICL
jgi:hypothetical protein